MYIENIFRDLGIRDFTLRGNDLYLKNKVELKTAKDVKLLESVKKNFYFDFGINAYNIPLTIKRVRDFNNTISLRLKPDSYKLSLIEGKEVVVYGVSIEKSKISVDNLKADFLVIRDVEIKDTVFTTRGIAGGKLKIADSTIGSHHLVLENAEFKSCEFIAESVVLSAPLIEDSEIKADTVMIHGSEYSNCRISNSSNLLLYKDFKGEFNLNNIKSCCLVLTDKVNDSDFKVEGSVDELVVLGVDEETIERDYKSLLEIDFKSIVYVDEYHIEDEISKRFKKNSTALLTYPL